MSKERIAFLYDYYQEKDELIAFNEEEYVMEELREAFARLNHRMRETKNFNHMQLTLVIILSIVIILFLLI